MRSAQSEIERILALPFRDADFSLETAARLTALYKRPEGTMTLRPTQSACLAAANEAGGLVGMIAVGEGKTLTSMLFATALNAQRTVLLVPSKLKRRAIEVDYPHLAQHWRLPELDRELFIASHDDVSSPRRSDFLEKLEPDLIVIDEAHAFRYSVSGGERSARTTRLLRYFTEADKAGRRVALCALSGTVFSKSLRDAGHLLWLSLRDGSPLPLSWPLINEWAECVDPLPKHLEWQRRRTGSVFALLKALGAEDSDLEGMRAAVKGRLIRSPGVVATKSSSVSNSLEIHEQPVKVPATVKRALSELRNKWVLPDDTEVDDALLLSKYARELGCGFYYRPVWPTGTDAATIREYVEARREWHAEVRRALSRPKPGLDSPGLLKAAAESGVRPSPRYDRWAQISKQVKPGKQAVWVDDFLAADAAQWGDRQPGIIWYRHIEFGLKVSALGGLTFFGTDTDDSGLALEAEDGSRSVVASIAAHGTGWRLHRFSRNLITYTSSSADTWEQLLGRTHRVGQDADVVSVYTYRHVPESVSAFLTARERARFVHRIGDNEQKLLSATCSFTG